MINHPKFYFFDPGVFNAIRPKGPLDEGAVSEGAVLEKDYPMAICYCFYVGSIKQKIDNIHILPLDMAIQQLPAILNKFVTNPLT